ncbi:MAG: hypothetical protein IEMM0002_0361 [bacterium]|nr:MAG: hypothetical protein IEMM0002_0361 [bacterium]
MSKGSGYTVQDVGDEEKPWYKLLFLLLFVVLVIMGIISYYTSSHYFESKLTSENPKTRRWAVNQMVEKGQSAGPAMLKIAVDARQDLEMRRLALFVLGEIKYSEGAGELLEIFADGPLVLREQSAYALGRIGDNNVLPDFVAAYSRAPKGLKLKILSAMGELGNLSAIETLAAAVSDDDELIRQTAELALKKIRQKNPL